MIRIDNSLSKIIADSLYVPYIGATSAVNLGSQNLLTTGTLGAGAITGTSFIIGANTLDTNEWAFLDGQDQAVKTTSSPTFAGLNIGSEDNSIFAWFAASIAQLKYNAVGLQGLTIFNSDTSASTSTRMAVGDTTGHYIAFDMPSVNYTTNLFGQARNTGVYIFNNGGTQRDLIIGTVGAKKLILGTNNAARLTIASGGAVSVGGAISAAGLTIEGYGDISSYTASHYSLTFTVSDPEVETFYPTTTERAIDLIEKFTPPDKWGGVSYYYNKDTNRMEAIDQKTGDILIPQFVKEGNIGRKLESKAKYEDGFQYDSASGKVRPFQTVKAYNTPPEGKELDSKTGEIKDKPIQKELDN